MYLAAYNHTAAVFYSAMTGGRPEHSIRHIFISGKLRLGLGLGCYHATGNIRKLWIQSVICDLVFYTLRNCVWTFRQWYHLGLIYVYATQPIGTDIYLTDINLTFYRTPFAFCEFKWTFFFAETISQSSPVRATNLNTFKKVKFTLDTQIDNPSPLRLVHRQRIPFLERGSGYDSGYWSVR